MKRKGINEMSYNGFTNFETWNFMLYFEEYLYEYLQEQQEQLNYQNIYKTVEYFVNEMYDGADKHIVGSTFLNGIINSFLNQINIKEVAEHLAHALGVEVSE